MSDTPPLVQPSNESAKRDMAVEPGLPAIDAELLYGVAMIARWLGLTESQAKALIDENVLPTWTMPGKTKRCAIKSELNKTFREYARRPGATAKSPPRKRKLLK
jgi:hypothetical protein